MHALPVGALFKELTFAGGKEEANVGRADRCGQPPQEVEDRLMFW